MIDYNKCDTCGYITKISVLTSDKECFNCKSEYQANWLEYPSPAAKGFYHQFTAGVYSYEEYVAEAYDFHEIQPTCLFLCALYELLLAGLTSDILKSYSVPQKVIDLILDSNNGQNKMALVFRELEDTTLKEAIVNNCNPLFYDKMQLIIQGRNKYIHGNYSALDHITIDDLHYIVENIIEVFVKLHNKFVVK